MEAFFKFKPGDIVVDKRTRIEGVVVGNFQYAHGPHYIQIKSRDSIFEWSHTGPEHDFMLVSEKIHTEGLAKKIKETL